MTANLTPVRWRLQGFPKGHNTQIWHSHELRLYYEAFLTTIYLLSPLEILLKLQKCNVLFKSFVSENWRTSIKLWHLPDCCYCSDFFQERGKNIPWKMIILSIGFGKGASKVESISKNFINFQISALFQGFWMRDCASTMWHQTISFFN